MGQLNESDPRSEFSAASKANRKSLWVYVGTYTQGEAARKKSPGHLIRDGARPANGKAKRAAPRGQVNRPIISGDCPGHKFLYSVNELGEFKGKRGGAVSAFEIDPASGKLSPLNQQSSVGEGPCHLVVDRQGKNVLVANYGSGSVACLP